MDAVERLVVFFETFTPARVQEMGDYYAADAFFKDPFNEVRRLTEIQGIFGRMFAQVEAPRFRVLSRVFDGREGFLIWDLEFRFRGGKPGCIHGVSHLKLAEDGRVTYHRDYWDTAEELYEKIPLLGGFMRWLKHRVG
jgi:steroid delta-isomerase